MRVRVSVRWMIHRDGGRLHPVPGGLVLEQRHGGVCELSGSHVLSRGGLQGGALWGDKLQALRAVPDGHGDHPGHTRRGVRPPHPDVLSRGNGGQGGHHRRDGDRARVVRLPVYIKTTRWLPCTYNGLQWL